MSSTLRLEPGASGFLLKDTDPPQLLHAIRVVAEGEALLAPAVTKRLISEFAALPDPTVAPDEPQVLTDREREVIIRVAAGLTNQEIAQELYISPLTAKTHVSRILTKRPGATRHRCIRIRIGSTQALTLKL